MASYQKYKKGWRAYVDKKGIRKSAVFDTKREAVEWATKLEASIIEKSNPDNIPNIPFSELLNRYIDEVSVHKRGERWERMRLQLIGRMAIGSVMLPDMNESHVAQWRDERLKQVSPDSVAREWSPLNHACNIAVKEWKWLKKNPFTDVRKPQRSKPRVRRITEEEIDRIMLACGYDEDKPLTATARVGLAFLFAIETAMRMGEITGLTWGDVDLEKRTAHLPITKNGSARTVPLSARAVELLEKARTEDSRCFGMTSQSLEALFRKCRARAMIEDLHFHDTRHEAITRLSKKLDVLELARVVGHRDLRSLMVYYNPTAEELAKKL